jgi:hypothetical protein
MQLTPYTNGSWYAWSAVPFTIGSPDNTGVVAQTIKPGFATPVLAVPLGGSGGNFNQFPLDRGLNLCPGFPVSFGDPIDGWPGLLSTVVAFSLYFLVPNYLQKSAAVKEGLWDFPWKGVSPGQFLKRAVK